MCLVVVMVVPSTWNAVVGVGDDFMYLSFEEAENETP